MRPDVRDGRTIVILKAFADESADSELYVIAGYVSDIETWDDFAIRWTNELKTEPEVRYYRNNEAFGLKGEFGRFTDAERDKKIIALAKLIPTENFWSIAAYLKKSDFEKLFIPNFNDYWADPYYMCASYLVMRTAYAFHDNMAKIDFVFDENGKVGRKYKFMYDTYTKILFPRMPENLRFKAAPYLDRIFGECEHKDDRTFPPLQAADMNAAWIRRRSSPLVQLWTHVDPYLSRVQRLDFEVTRSFLEGLVKMQNEHSDEIRTFFRSIGSKPDP